MALVAFARVGRAQDIRAPIGSICEKSGVKGGLCVQVGSDDLAATLDLARTGRVLVEILDTDAAKVERARKQIHSTGLYGLISANRWASDKPLPYAEDLVNLVPIAPFCLWRASSVARYHTKPITGGYFATDFQEIRDFLGGGQETLVILADRCYTENCCV